MAKYWTAFSSEVYKIDPKDLDILGDVVDAQKTNFDGAVVLLGNSRKNTKDVLYQGRDLVKKAIENGVGYIPVRFVFETRTRYFNFFSSLIKGLRKHFNGYGSNTYHVLLKDIEELGIERSIRTYETAYQFSRERDYVVGPKQRAEVMGNMEKSFKEKGYDDRYPMDILLCRAFGVKDNLHQGHHRMMFSRKFGIERVAVRFVAAGHMPLFLHPIFMFLYKIFGRRLKNES